VTVRGEAAGVDCPSGKIAFASRHAATHSRGGRHNKGLRMRAYFCDRCHRWHLTTDVGSKP
jgi:hypothetical protein